ncbi:hypothetical protein NQ318_005539 [Aromia moschata]|uniref:MADF domain-containing protein n=1 Tax=Aromia moschata TaxID=1265417 RepID=A0AAV8XH45_9CUCU|nr:hypothetical protein NQ318_005539 [Aromia moschata]
MSREFIEGFISVYRENPCLWQIKCKEYTNENLKARAYDNLVTYCKSNGYSNVNRDFVMKKIENLRGCFRKEMRKVESSKTTGTGSDDI